MFHSRARKEQEKRPKRRLDHTPWLHSHAVLNTQTAVLPSSALSALRSARSRLQREADFWTDDVAQKSGMTKNAAPSGARNTKVLLDGVYSRVISWLFSPNNSSTAITIIWLNKKTVAFMSEEKRQFFVIPPVGNKSAKLWTQNKTEIKRHFYDSNVSLHCSKRVQSNSFTLSNFLRKKVKKHKKIFNMQKIVSFRPAMIKKRGKQREAHYNFSSSKKLKIFLDSCYDEGARDAMNNGRIFPALLYGNAAMPTLIQMSRVEQSLPINYAHHHWKNESLESCPKTCSFS